MSPKMGVTLLIKFENESRSFYPGEIIRGIVTMWNDSEVKAKNLTITFFGEAEVYWTESEVRYNTTPPVNSQPPRDPFRRHVQREYRNQEAILCEEFVLFGQSASAEGGPEYVIPPGVQEYPFAAKLPNSLPSSFSNSPYGFVRYTAEARLKKPLFRYDRVEQEFIVNGILDLNFIPNVQQPFGVDQRKELGWMCCHDGSILLDMKLQKTGFVHGENLRFSVNVINISRAVVECLQAIFTQETQFITFDKKKVTSVDLAFTTYGYRIEDGAVIDWNDSFTIPNNTDTVPPTNLAGCHIIRVNYYLTVHAKLRGITVCVSAPITIGTGPCSLHSSAIPPVITVSPPSPDSVLLTIRNPVSASQVGTSTSTYISEVSSSNPFEPVAGPSFPKRENEVLLNNNAEGSRCYDISQNPFLRPDE